MPLLESANKECLRLRMERDPYKPPEFFPNPSITSTQLIGALIAVQKELDAVKEQLARLSEEVRSTPQQ